MPAYQQRSQQNQHHQQQNMHQEPVNLSLASALLIEFGKKYNIAVSNNEVNPNRVLETLIRTCFVTTKPITEEQMVALLIVAKEYNLNPFTREIYAYPAKNGGIVPIVGIDGWCSMVNSHAQYIGMEFRYSDEVVDMLGDDSKPNGKTAHVWMECALFRKDREKPTIVREYFAEVFKFTDPWKACPNRMLRHKTLIQCARYAFSLTGIYDHDDGLALAAEVIEGEYTETTNQNQAVEKTIETVVHVANQSEQHTHQEQQQVQDDHPAEQPPAEQQQAQENTVQKPYMTEAIFKKMLLKVKTLVVNGTMSMTQFIAQAETMYSLTPEQIEQFNVEAKQ